MHDGVVLEWDVLVKYPRAAWLAAKAGQRFGLDMWGAIDYVTLGWWRARDEHLLNGTAEGTMDEYREELELSRAIELGLRLEELR